MEHFPDVNEWSPLGPDQLGEMVYLRYAAFAASVPKKRRDAYEAFIRCTGDCVEFVHTQRFMDDDGEPVAEGSSVRRLRTVNPHGALPQLLRIMRRGPLAYGTKAEVDEGMRLAREVLGPQRETPALMEGADEHAFPMEDTRHIAILWDFIHTLNARLVRSLAARENPRKLVYAFAARDAAKAAPLLTPDLSWKTSWKPSILSGPDPGRTRAPLGPGAAHLPSIYIFHLSGNNVSFLRIQRHESPRSPIRRLAEIDLRKSSGLCRRQLYLRQFYS